MSYDGFPAPFPAAANAAGILIGCEGITYRIDAYGRALDAQVISEYPPGYGFGEQGLTVLNHLKICAWRYRSKHALLARDHPVSTKRSRFEAHSYVAVSDTSLGAHELEPPPSASPC